MRELLVIWGYGGKQELINYNFQRFWSKLNLPYMLLGPTDDMFELPGAEFTLEAGKSTRYGVTTIERMLALLEALSKQPYDRFLVMECDCINIGPLPEFEPGLMCSRNAAVAPWRFDKESVLKIYKLGIKHRPQDEKEICPCHVFSAGMKVPLATDWWLHKFASISGVPIHQHPRAWWAWEWDDDVIDEFREGLRTDQISFIHGLKTIEETERVLGDERLSESSPD